MSWTEIGLILIVGVVLFGQDNRLPEIARSIGKAVGEFKRAMSPSEPHLNERPYHTESETSDSAEPEMDLHDSSDPGEPPPGA